MYRARRRLARTARRTATGVWCARCVAAAQWRRRRWRTPGELDEKGRGGPALSPCGSRGEKSSTSCRGAGGTERAGRGAAGPYPPGARPPVRDVWRAGDCGAPLLSIVLRGPSGRRPRAAPWPAIAAILVIARSCEPASDCTLPGSVSPQSAGRSWACRPSASTMTGCTARRPRPPHKQALETDLKERLGACSISTMSCCCMM